MMNKSIADIHNIAYQRAKIVLSIVAEEAFVAVSCTFAELSVANYPDESSSRKNRVTHNFQKKSSAKNNHDRDKRLY